MFWVNKKVKIICCVICAKHRKCKNPETSYIFEKVLVFSIICSKCENEDEKII